MHMLTFCKIRTDYQLSLIILYFQPIMLACHQIRETSLPQILFSICRSALNEVGASVPLPPKCVEAQPLTVTRSPMILTK